MKLDWIAYLLPLGMLVAPLAYYHDSRALRATIGNSNVLVGECEAAVRDKSLVINVAYPKTDAQPAAVNARKVCKAD